MISFDDILTNCGRVLEHDTHTRVVALDIGSNVGVTLGQEFKVFLPTFSGSTKFLLNDGRTKRTLGTYPRVESARVVVFNVQPEISFAFIANPTETPPPLVAGSLLEAIPAGSIGHLLPSSSRYFQTSSPSPDRDGLTELQTFVRTAAEKGSPFAVVVRFSRDGEYLRKYGSVALNMALSQLYREAQLTFHAAKSVEVLDRSSICVAGLNAAYKESLVTTFVDSIAAELPELGVYAGVFCEQDRKPSESDDLEALDASNAIEFARFAASDAGRLADARVRHFSHSVAYAALQALRDSRSLEVAYADFQRLRKLGVESARLLNLGGLIAGGLGHVQEAVELYAAAMAKDPKELIYKSNYGTAAYRVGEIEPALKVLNALPNKDVEKLSGLHPYGYLGYARLLARAKLNGSPLFDAARFAVLSAAVLTLPQYAESPELTVIREALQKQ